MIAKARVSKHYKKKDNFFITASANTKQHFVECILLFSLIGGLHQRMSGCFICKKTFAEETKGQTTDKGYLNYMKLMRGKNGSQQDATAKNIFVVADIRYQ
jgi:hypothetical protein